MAIVPEMSSCQSSGKWLSVQWEVVSIHSRIPLIAYFFGVFGFARSGLAGAKNGLVLSVLKHRTVRRIYEQISIK